MRVWKSAIALTLVVVSFACGDERAAATDHVASGSASPAHVELAPIVATCAETIGTTEIRRKGQVRWEKVDVGATFRERDWVRTGPRGFARLRFGTRGFLDLAENTTVLVDSAITVESGIVVGTAGEKPVLVTAVDGSQARIAAGPDGPAEFRLTPSDSKGLEIAVTKGKLRVITKDGERIVSAGEATDLAKQRTSDNVKLLGFPKSLAPGVDAQFLFAPKMQIPLTWTRVEGAARYHVQIARDTDFHSLVLETETATPTSALAPDREGVYVWRIAARDAAGRLGEYGFARRIFCQTSHPPSSSRGDRSAAPRSTGSRSSVRPRLQDPVRS
jgi:hypothetical protein